MLIVIIEVPPDGLLSTILTPTYVYTIAHFGTVPVQRFWFKREFEEGLLNTRNAIGVMK